MSDHVTYELDGDVAVVRIDDGKANALSHDLIGAIDAAIDRAEGEAKALVLIGREGKFSAGFDLRTMQAGPQQARDLLAAGAALGLRLYELPMPVVLGVTGHALAMGAILLYCADVRIGAEGPFKLGLNEVAIGMPVPRFAVELARDCLSKRHFNAAVNLAQVFDPAAAVDAGYLDRILPADQVAPAAIERATELAATLHPGPFALTRTYVRGELTTHLRTILAEDIAAFSIAAD
ncbi:MAG: crotonase/enoyl-CoA hydratase family protein [Acidimicrobiales bacterium]|jgi:enoyl-CoA hydratase|nr:crotonase/enoyl-CoA hydratase family protein [Acidimicrobiales bacterium]